MEDGRKKIESYSVEHTFFPFSILSPPSSFLFFSLALLASWRFKSSPSYPRMPWMDYSEGIDNDADHRGAGTNQDLSRLPKEPRPRRRSPQPVPPQVQGSPRRRRRFLPDRTRRDDHAKDARRPHLSHDRDGPRPRLRSLGSARRLPAAVLTDHGAEEPTLVGPARRRQLSTPP